MLYDFRKIAGGDIPGFHVSPINVEQDQWGYHLYCMSGFGSYFMVDHPRPEGLWQVHSKISAGATVAGPTTKVCDLLWPAQPPDKSTRIWPPEIDWNESGDRSRSNQTLHYGTRAENFMHHTTYTVDQTEWHTYGVRVLPGQISYLLDGIEQAHVDNDVPLVVGYNGLGWNMHIRTELNGSLDVTKMDVRWIEIPD